MEFHIKYCQGIGELTPDPQRTNVLPKQGHCLKVALIVTKKSLSCMYVTYVCIYVCIMHVCMHVRLQAYSQIYVCLAIDQATFVKHH